MGPLEVNIQSGKGQISFVFWEGNRTAQCNVEHACRHFSDKQNL